MRTTPSRNAYPVHAASLLILVSLAAGGAGVEGASMTTFTLTSPAFQDQAAMPKRFTCQGRDSSPPLAWSGAPAGTMSFALILDDPDAPDPAAPQTTWVHWVVYDIPAGTTALAEGAAAHLPAGSRDGKNDWDKAGYGGPCPP